MPSAAMTDSPNQPETTIPLRCFCGNAVLRRRLTHEANAVEVVTSLCPQCDTGDFEETFYSHPDGRLLPRALWMESQGLLA